MNPSGIRSAYAAVCGGGGGEASPPRGAAAVANESAPSLTWAQIPPPEKRAGAKPHRYCPAIPMVTLRNAGPLLEAVTRLLDDHDRIVLRRRLHRGSRKLRADRADRSSRDAEIVRCSAGLMVAQTRTSNILQCRRSTLGNPLLSRNASSSSSQRALAPSLLLESSRRRSAISAGQTDIWRQLAQRGYRFCDDHVTHLRIEPREHLPTAASASSRLPLRCFSSDSTSSPTHPADFPTALPSSASTDRERIEG